MRVDAHGGSGESRIGLVAADVDHDVHVGSSDVRVGQVRRSRDAAGRRRDVAGSGLPVGIGSDEKPGELDGAVDGRHVDDELRAGRRRPGHGDDGVRLILVRKDHGRLSDRREGAARECAAFGPVQVDGQGLAPANRQRALDRHLDLADREGPVDAEAGQVEGAREVRFEVETAHRVDTGDRVPADDVLGCRLRDLRGSAGATLRDRATGDRMRTAGVGQYLRRERTVQRREDRQTREPEAPRDDEKHGSSRRVTDALPFVMDRVVRFYASLYGRVRVSDRRQHVGSGRMWRGSHRVHGSS